MKIFVINAKKFRWLAKLFRISAFVLAVVLVSALFINTYNNSQAYVSALQIENEKKTVILDAGHGGEDPGAIGANGRYEKDLNLEISKEIGNLLKKEGFAVIYTRTTDKLLYNEDENIKGIRKISDLKNRCKIAKDYPNAIFLSIHMNSYADSRFKGLQVYYSENNETSKSLASNIQLNVKEKLQNDNNRKIKAGKNMYLLENINSTAVLVECGFLTNSEECDKLSEKEYQKLLSSAIVCGIISYSDKVSIY